MTVWMLAGDPALHNPGLLDALRRLDLTVVAVQPGEAVRFWSAAPPDLLLFGASALCPPHPLVVRFSGRSTHTMLVTERWNTVAVDPSIDSHLVLPGPPSRLMAALQRALGRAPAPVRVAV